MSLVVELSEKRLKYKSIHRESIMNKLSDVQGSQRDTERRKYFSQLWECYTWAAIIGFINDKRVPLSGATDNAFKFSVIYNNGGELADALILLSMSKSDKGYKALIDADEIIKVIEEYANGGFEIIQSLLREDEDYFNNPDTFIEELLERKELNLENN